MADETPTFGGLSSGDAADAFAKVISKIKSDMAAIEASAKNIEISLSKASRHSVGGSGFTAQNAGGGTGFSSSLMNSSLGSISDPPGGWKGTGRAAAFALGALPIGSGMGGIGGGIALAGLPDLIMRPERALNMEAARFGMAQATGSFGTFKRMMDVARNDFNVQNEQLFMNTMVAGVQRMGMVGLMGGGTVGERRAAAQIGGYNTLAGMAGIDQSQVPGVMESLNSAQAYYASMAAGVMTRNPVTGELIGIEGQINQMWDRMFAGRNLTRDDIDREFGIGSTGERQLIEMTGGNREAIEMIKEGLRIRAGQGGRPLKENQVQEQAKALGENGGIDNEYTQGMDATRKLESEKMNMGEKYLNDATAGIEEAAKHITTAVELLADLEGPLETMVGAYTTLANQMDVFKTELPDTTDDITSFFKDLPKTLLGVILGVFGRSMLARLGISVGASVLAPAAAAVAPVAALGAGLVTATAGVGLAGKWAVNKFTDYDEHKGVEANRSIADKSWESRTSSYPTFSKGEWFVEADQIAQIHYGEMVLPNRVATAVREELALGKTSPTSKKTRSDGSPTININLTIQKATDQEALYLANRVKRILDTDEELLAMGVGRFAGG